MSNISTITEGLAQIFALPLLRLTLSNPRPGAEYQKIVGRTVPLRARPSSSWKSSPGPRRFTKMSRWKKLPPGWKPS